MMGVFRSLNLVCLVVQITMNAHASLSYVLAALGINLVPTMPMIYVVFATLVSILLCSCNELVDEVVHESFLVSESNSWNWWCAACDELWFIRFPSSRLICHLFTAIRFERLLHCSRMGRASYLISPYCSVLLLTWIL